MTVYTKTMMESLAEVRGIQIEGREKDARQLVDPKKEVMIIKKNKVVVIDKKDQDKYLKQGWELAEEKEVVAKGIAKKAVIATGLGVTAGSTALPKKDKEDKNEEVELDEDNMALMRKASGGAMQTLKMKDGKLKMDSFTASAVMQVYDKVKPANQKKMAKMINQGTRDGMVKLQSFAMKQVKAGYGEETEFVERTIAEIVAEQLAKIRGNTPADKGRRAAVEDDIERAEKKGDKKEVAKLKEAELDEGRMKELHGYIEAGKSAEWIAKKMGVDVKTIKALMSEAYELGTNEYREYIEKLTPGEVDEASARADAIRAMRRGKKEVDPADVDTDASPEDVKGASKNIIMQLRKVISMRGNFDVEFLDRKKKKVPVNIAHAVQNKYNSFKKPADKEKFQAQVAKSYKDMLSVLKAGYNEETELDETYGTVKISGKRGRIIQHSPGEVVFVGNKKQTEKNLKQLKKDGGDGYIMQGVTIKVGEKVKGVGEEVELDEEKFDYTIVAIKNKKVVDQQHSISKLEFKDAIKLFKKNNPGAKISIEDKGGKIVHTEEVDETILDRIDKKLKERKEILEVLSNRWELAGKKFSLVRAIRTRAPRGQNDKGTFILVPQGRAGKEQELKAKTTQDATQELVKKGYKES